MTKTILTPEESLLLITKTIQDTKTKFTEKGHLFIFWGVLTTIASLSHFVLAQFELYNFIGYAYLLMPLGAIYAFVSEHRNKKKNNIPKTIIENILMVQVIILTANFMILGFLFREQLGENMTTVFLIFLALLTTLTGVSIKFKPVIIGGISLNLLAFVPYFIDWHYHPLIFTAAAVTGLIIPGILLNKNNRKEHV